jgi:hypothetical protein
VVAEVESIDQCNRITANQREGVGNLVTKIISKSATLQFQQQSKGMAEVSKGSSHLTLQSNQVLCSNYASHLQEAHAWFDEAARHEGGELAQRLLAVAVLGSLCSLMQETHQNELHGISSTPWRFQSIVVKTHLTVALGSLSKLSSCEVPSLALTMVVLVPFQL